MALQSIFFFTLFYSALKEMYSRTTSRMMNSYLFFPIALYTLQFLSYLYLSLFAISFFILALDRKYMDVLWTYSHYYWNYTVFHTLMKYLKYKNFYTNIIVYTLYSYLQEIFRYSINYLINYCNLEIQFRSLSTFQSCFNPN